MKINRRKFIKNTSLVICSQLFQRSFAFNNNVSDPHFFLSILVDGGMDTTLGLEPLIHKTWKTDQLDIFLEYRPEEIIKKGNLHLGPAAASLSKHYQDICIVNGIDMKRDDGHIEVRDYLFSGDKEKKSALLPIELEFNRLKKSPAGVLVNFSPLFGSRSVVLSSIENLTNSNQLSAEASAILSGFEGKDALFSSINSLNEIERSRPLFESSINRMQSLGYERNALSSIAASFESGVANYCALNLRVLADANEVSQLARFSLDTHSNHEADHLENQKSVWEGVSYIFDLFKSIEFNGKSLFDFTTFMVGSEFGRTPFLNGAKGKDHNTATNSVLFAGKNIRGNHIIGASRVIKRQKSKIGKSSHEAMKYNFKEKKIVKLSNIEVNNKYIQLIHPENLVLTVGRIFGQNSESFYPPNQSLVLHDLIKS